MPDIRDEKDRGSPDSRNGLQPELFPDWSNLAVLLAIFVLVSIIALLAILQGGATVHPEEATATRAYSPADFPDLEWDLPLLPAVVDAVQQDAPGVFNVPPPPFSEEGIFPCTDCHADLEVDTERRELGFHEEIQAQLDHGPQERWCLDCHSATNRDKLHLITGAEIGFEESYRLCGQCHGTIFRDWRAGIHGRRRGYWNGAKSYLLCAHCHNPHSPKFAPLPPLPPPVRPQFLAAHHEDEP